MLCRMKPSAIGGRRGAPAARAAAAAPSLRPAAVAAALRSSRRPHVRASASASAGAAAKLADTPLTPVMDKGDVQTSALATAGVYAVFDASEAIQYVGLSRKIDASVANHMAELPELTHAVKVLPMSDTSREALVAAWKAWVEESVELTGAIPPGNQPGETKWQARKAAPMKREVRLTAGKAINVPIEELVDKLVKDAKVVAFVKGTRTQPACGFSFKMLQMLNESRVDFEVVNVLDEEFNPGLRDAIKKYSQWPTIPQLYVGGEFVGGADIVEQMNTTGELGKLLKGGQ